MVTANLRRRLLLSRGAGLLAGVAAFSWRIAGASDQQGTDTSPDAVPGSPVLLVLGDSLSAEYGLARGQGWVALLQQRLAGDASLRRWHVVNASISGETSAGGLARLPQLLQQYRPDVVLIELGGNDALQGLSLKALATNLQEMADKAKAAGSRVILVGMQVPPNYGPAYAQKFERLFAKVAGQADAPLVPFLMDGFGDDPTWFQADGIHPLARAHPRMLDNVWSVLRKMLRP